MNPLEKQVQGDHYKGYSYQPVQFLMDVQLVYPVDCAIKYLSRTNAEKDGGGIGIDKAIHYLEIFEQYWLEHDIYPYSNIPNAKSVERFKEQFTPNIAHIIEEVVRLQTGLDWAETNDPIRCYEHPLFINKDNLKKSVATIINLLNELKKELNHAS